MVTARNSENPQIELLNMIQSSDSQQSKDMDYYQQDDFQLDQDIQILDFEQAEQHYFKGADGTTDNPNRDQKRDRRREIERMSQQRQRQRRRDATSRLSDEIEHLNSLIMQQKKKNSEIRVDRDELQKVMDLYQQESNRNYYEEFLFREKNKNKLPRSHDYKISDEDIQELKLVEISVLYIKFTENLRQFIKSHEQDRDNQTKSLQFIQSELSEFVPLLGKIMVINRNIPENILDLNFETLQSDNRQCKAVIQDMRTVVAQLDLSEQQKVHLHELMAQHILSQAETSCLIMKFVVMDTRKLIAHRCLKANSMDNQVAFDIVKNKEKLLHFKSIFFGDNKDSMISFYHKILRPDQLAKIYLLTYPYIPNLYLMMVDIYLEIESGIDKEIGRLLITGDDNQESPYNQIKQLKKIFAID